MYLTKLEIEKKMDVEKFFKECLINMGYITFEIAKKLNEKGFNWDRITTYNTMTKVRNNHLEPTISQVLKWLREKHLLVIPTPFLF